VDGLGAATAIGGRATAHVTGAVAGGVTVAASSPGLAPASAGFSVVPGAPAHLAFTSPTTDLASGATRDLAVELDDAHGNRVPTTTVPISFAQSGGSGTVVGLPVAAGTSGGVATTSVTGFLRGPVTITATSSGLIPATTTFKVAPGPAPRHVRLKLSRRVLSGKLTSGASGCRSRVRIRIDTQSKAGRAWKSLKRVQTTAAGTFKLRISHAARYRAVAPAQPGCAVASSKPLRVTAAALKP
jgi:hypothetical protein